MRDFDWQRFLTAFSRDLLSAERIASAVGAEVSGSRWMGFAPASERDLLALEERLGLALPPSYRGFLATSNGWRQTGYFIDEIWPCSAVCWLRERRAETISAWNASPSDVPIPDDKYLVYGVGQDPAWMRRGYLRSCLEISDWGDASILLLNPEIVFPDGEWEAWQLATWYPGVRRFRSFRELMEDQRASFLELLRGGVE